MPLLPCTASDAPVELERGSTLVEYAIVVALISVIAVAGIRRVGHSVSSNATCVSLNLHGVPCQSAAGNGDGP